MIRTRGVTGTIRFPLPLQVLGAALWLLVLSSVLVYGAMIAVTRLLEITALTDIFDLRPDGEHGLPS